MSTVSHCTQVSHEPVNGENVEVIELQQAQRAHAVQFTGRARIREGGVPSLIMRVCGLLLVIGYLALFVRYQVVFHNLIVVAYIAVSLCFEPYLALLEEDLTSYCDAVGLVYPL
jgi:hypothetical protein